MSATILPLEGELSSVEGRESHGAACGEACIAMTVRRAVVVAGPGEYVTSEYVRPPSAGRRDVRQLLLLMVVAREWGWRTSAHASE